MNVQLDVSLDVVGLLWDVLDSSVSGADIVGITAEPLEHDGQPKWRVVVHLVGAPQDDVALSLVRQLDEASYTTAVRV